MKLFYAMGGGWGHLYRVRTFISQFGITDFKILSNNPLAVKLFSTEEILHVPGETRNEVAEKVQSLIRLFVIDEFYIDTFPIGLFGELTHVEDIRIIYLARRLRWVNYRVLLNGANVRFDHTYWFEPLEKEHEEFISEFSTLTDYVELHYPPPDPERIPLTQIPTGKPIWLIVHSFEKGEVDLLLHYARDIARIENKHPAFIVLSDQPVTDNDVMCYTWLPASDWFPLADRIFTGGGFNVMKQVAPFWQKVTAIPFPRRYDDQAWRIARMSDLYRVGTIL